MWRGERLCRTTLQGFCSLELTFIISSAGIFFSHSDEITLKVKKGLQIITVCQCRTDFSNKGGQGFYWLFLEGNTEFERMPWDTETSCSAVGATASFNPFH